MSDAVAHHSYFIVLGELGMLGLSNGASPADAVATFCGSMDVFGSSDLDDSYREVAKALLIPDDLEEAAELICEGLDPEDALPRIEALVAYRPAAVWSWVDVGVRDGERVCTPG